MNRRAFLRKAGCAGLAWCGAAAGRRARADAARTPNIVFIYIDDLGWKDVGFMGGPIATPHIDRIAAEGMRFTAAYACAPNCAPSRACLLTGQYTPRHGIYTVGSSERGKSRLRKLIPTPNTTTLAAGAVTIAEALKPAGYTCASMGKWHMGDDPDHGPTGQGFDVNVAGNHCGHPPAGYYAPYELPTLSDAPKGEYLTNRIADEALAFIEAQRAAPFFLYLTHYAVHTPIQPPPDYDGAKDQRAQYEAMVRNLDRNVGRILDTLDRLGLSENTMVVFFSDNGGYVNVTSMEPLRGAKGMIYEGGIRVPLAVRWPGVVAPGTTCATPVIGVDFFPALIEAAGAAAPQNHVLDGESLLPLLEQSGPLERDALFWHFPAYLQSSNAAQWPWRATPCGAIRQGDWKLIEFFEDGRLELYNLRGDLGESTNLAGAQPAKTQALHARLKAWRRRLNAPVPDTPNPGYNPKAR